MSTDTGFKGDLEAYGHYDSTDLDAQLDEILARCFGDRGEPARAREDRKLAKQALTKLIADREREARIDELVTLWPKFTDIHLDGTNGPEDNPQAQRKIHSRIRELERKKEEL